MDNKKEEIRQAYYYTDIEPTLENLHEIIRICEIFIKEGGDRLMWHLMGVDVALDDRRCGT